MAGTTYAAVVRVVDLPAAGTITGAEVLEVVQTTSGVSQSVQVSLTNAISGIGGLPSAGGTGQLLQSSGTSFVATWTSVSSIITVGPGLVTSGSATAFAARIGTAAVISSMIATNAIGTNQLASSLGIASSLSVGTLITVGGTATVTGTTILNGGLQVVGTAIMTGTLGVSGTASFNSIAIPAGGSSAITFSSTAGFGVYFGSGAPSVSAATGSLYLRSDPANATSRMYVNITGTGVWTPLTAFS